MKRILALILALLLALTACTANNTNNNETTEEGSESSSEISNERFASLDNIDWSYSMPEFSGLNDELLLRYMEDEVYSQVVSSLDSTEYIVERVSATYLSKEYLEELAYNSQSNIFFGYSLSDLDAYFGDTKYVFTMGEDGQTTVQELISIAEEDYYNKIITNVAIGAGVILVCVVITVATEGAGAPAAAAIFAASAKTAATCALSGMVISGVSAGLIKAYQTGGDVNETLKSAAIAGSEGFKWGAIGGAVSGGAREAFVLAKATANGLTMNQVALIQQESGYPLELIREFHSIDEYSVFKAANLKPYPINGQTALIRTDIDPLLKDEFGVTNLDRMLSGKSPISSLGETFELHHVGQSNDGVLAILTTSEHDNAALHGFKAVSEIDRTAFAKIRSDFWKSYANLLVK